jgi:hypothetical protein
MTDRPLVSVVVPVFNSAARSLAAFGELRRFLKPLAVRVARRVTEVEVQHRPRTEGASAYSVTALVRLFMDFFVNALGDVFAWVFMVATGLTLVLLLAAVATVFMSVASRTLVGYAIPLMLLAIHAALVALFGLVGEYVQRIYRQSSGRPFFLVRRMYDSTRPSAASVLETPGARR